MINPYLTDPYLVPMLRLVSETRAIVLVQAGTQANQFGIAINYTANITNFTGN